MKESIHDKIVKRKLALQKRVEAKLGEMNRGARPFASKKISPDEIIWAWDNMGYEDFPEIRQQYGDFSMNLLGDKVHQLKRKRDGKVTEPVQPETFGPEGGFAPQATQGTQSFQI